MGMFIQSSNPIFHDPQNKRQPPALYGHAAVSSHTEADIPEKHPDPPPLPIDIDDELGCVVTLLHHCNIWTFILIPDPVEWTEALVRELLGGGFCTQTHQRVCERKQQLCKSTEDSIISCLSNNTLYSLLFCPFRILLLFFMLYYRVRYACKIRPCCSSGTCLRVYLFMCWKICCVLVLNDGFICLIVGMFLWPTVQCCISGQLVV